MPQRDPDFAYLAHDLNQLLWAIQGRARALATRLGREGEPAAAARSIAEDAAAAAAMLAGEGEAAADTATVARAAWRQALDRASALGHDTGAVTCEGPDAAPAVAIPPSTLRRILGNLFANALEAMPGGGTVRWRAERRGEQVVLTVEDSGPGVAPSLADRLFDEGATGGKSGGRGLGLAGSRALARRHGGELAHAPAPSGGARFQLELPPAASIPAPTAEQDDVTATSVPWRVLVVDDEAPVREMLAELLASEGHSAVLAVDADTALAQTSPARYDAALIDLGLPGRDGADLARSLRETDPALALVIFTGWGREQQLAELDPGLADFTATKPIDLPQLRRLLDRAAGLTAARRG